MIQIDNIEVFNFDGAFRGLRNPMNSWSKSDSGFVYDKNDGEKSNTFIIGPNDLKLAQRMIGGGPEESKFLRQIMVSMDITLPLFVWKELDTYKVATTANSCSTMHKLTSEEITLDKFSFTNFKEIENPNTQFLIKDIQEYVIADCELLRKVYNETKDPLVWRALVEILPSAWNQKRTWTANYQVLRNIYFQRRNHKLQEWRDFTKIIENLPYGKELICYEKK